jgi:hypothetical protein
VTKKKQESSFPSFPKEVIKGFAKEFVQLYQGKREVPDELLWAAFATYFGSLISPYASLQGFEASEPRLYTAIVGRSGRTKKSTAQNLARDFIKSLYPNTDSQLRIIEGFGSAEGLVSQLEKLSSLSTPAILHLDEINVLAQKTGMDGSVGIAVLNKLFEDHQYEHPLRDKNTQIKNTRLSVVGASTVEDYQKAWSGKHKDTGFLSRILIIPAEPSALRISMPIAPDAQHYQRLQTGVRAYYEELRKNPRAFEIEPESMDLWQSFYEQFKDGEEWNRIDAYGFRLMTLQAALTSQKSITREVMEDVIKLSIFEAESRVMVSPVIAENQLAMMEQLIRRQLDSGVTLTRRELQRKTNADRYGITHFRTALANLENAEEIKSEKKGKTVSYTQIIEVDETDEDSLSPVISFCDDRCAV